MGGLTIGGQHYAQHYAGAFNDPPDANNYIFESFIWDRGSPALAVEPERWAGRASVGGLLRAGGDHSRHLQHRGGGAAAHVERVGQIVVTGVGGGQNPAICTEFTPALASHTGWLWQPVGITEADIARDITAAVFTHDHAPAAHADIRALVPEHNGGRRART